MRTVICECPVKGHICTRISFIQYSDQKTRIFQTRLRLILTKETWQGVHSISIHMGYRDQFDFVYILYLSVGLGMRAQPNICCYLYMHRMHKLVTLFLKTAANILGYGILDYCNKRIIFFINENLASPNKIKYFQELKYYFTK